MDNDIENQITNDEIKKICCLSIYFFIIKIYNYKKDFLYHFFLCSIYKYNNIMCLRDTCIL